MSIKPLGKSAFEEPGAESAIEMFIRQTTEACELHNEPLPEIVKNYTPGDTVLYKTERGNLQTKEIRKTERRYEELIQGDFPEDFDMVNNNGE